MSALTSNDAKKTLERQNTAAKKKIIFEKEKQIQNNEFTF
jgi:hypothetical protein